MNAATILSSLCVMLCAALLATGCRSDHATAIEKQLADQGFEEISLERERSDRYRFEAVRQGYSCEGTVSLLSLTRSYNVRHKYDVDVDCSR